MSGSRWVRLGVLVALLAALLTGPAAQAQQRSWNDDTQDMWALAIEEESDPVADPSHVNGDVERVTVAHRARAVVIRVEFLALDRLGDGLGLLGSVRTNERVRRYFELFASPGAWAGEMWPRGVSHRIDYAADVVTIRWPRRLLSRPRWVQVRLVAADMVFGPGEQEGTFWIDDANSDGYQGTRWSVRVRRG